MLQNVKHSKKYNSAGMAITQVTVLCTLIHFGGFIFQAQENAVNINFLQSQESTNCVIVCFCPKKKE